MVRASLKPSFRLAFALSLPHVGAVAVIVPLDLPVWIRTALAPVISASLLCSVWRHALLRSKRSVRGIEIADHEIATVETRGNVWHAARILGSSYVTPSLTVLNLRIRGERVIRHVLLVPGNIDAHEFRRIRVLLRWSRAAKDSP